MRKLVKRLLYPVIIIERLVDAGRRMLPTRNDFKELAGCFKLSCGKFSCMWQWRKQLPPEPRHFLGNLAVGLAITLLLHSFHDDALLSEIEDRVIDWMVGIYQGTTPNDHSIPLGWVDIDNKTYEKWNAPLFVPRYKLAQLMKFILRSDPKMLLLDVDLAKRSHKPELDQPVIDLLTVYNNHCNDKPLFSDPDCPPIVFAASLHRSDTDQLLQRESYLDRLVAESKHLFWASPAFDKDADGITRRWRLWDVVCRNGKPVALPSFQLLAANLLTNVTDVIYKNASCLNAMLPKACFMAPGHETEKSCNYILWSKRLGKEKQIVDLSWDRLVRRIRYNIPWHANPERSGGSPTMIPSVTTYSNQKRLLLAWLPAYAVPISSIPNDLFADKGPLSANEFKDRVVFIGGSFMESQDFHETPLGEMPGVLIIINALHSLLQHNVLKQVELYWIVLIETGLIVMMSIFFTKWNAFFAKATSTITVIIVLLPLSVICFGHGLWLDFALPLLAVYFHEVVARIEENRAEHRVSTR